MLWESKREPLRRTADKAAFTSSVSEIRSLLVREWGGIMTKIRNAELNDPALPMPSFKPELRGFEQEPPEAQEEKLKPRHPAPPANLCLARTSHQSHFCNSTPYSQ